MLEGWEAEAISCYAEGGYVSALRFYFLFAIFVLAVSTSVHASEGNTLRIENLNSISSIVNPVTLDLARSVNAAPEWRNFNPPQAFWSPDGSKLLIRSSIRWYPDDVNFRPSNRNGIDAMYTLDADGTNLTKIVSNEINSRSTPIELPIELPVSPGYNPWSYNPWSPSRDKIVIVASVPGMGVFYLLANPNGDGINVLGTNFSDITSANLSEISRQRDFTWSPEGIRAAFVVTDPINKSEMVYVADADGFNIKQLASEVNESFLGSIAWNHDGKQIAFSGNNLWIVNSDGIGLKQLGACSGGVWSPDDSKLLCTSSEGVNDQFLNHLYLIDVESGDKTELIKSIEVESPIWNPDGSSILFKSITERRNHGIYVADSKGTNIKLIYKEDNPVERATIDAVSWSPDGSKIAFISLENGVKLYTVNPDGTGKTLLTSNLSWSWTNPYVWSPSGNKIAFSSSTADGEHIFVTNLDGTERMQITTGENKHYVLSGIGGSWSPDGSRLLIESRSNMPSKDEVFIAKLSGCDRAMPIRAPENVNLGEATTPQQTVDATQEPAEIADAPKIPGFSIIFAGIILIVSMFLKKRWNA